MFSINTYILSIENKIENLLSGKNWAIKATLLCIFLIGIFYVLMNSSPFYYRLKGLYMLSKDSITAKDLANNNYMYYYWEFMQEQANDLLKRRNIDTRMHESNMIYRLTIPIIFKISHVNILGMYFFQLLLGLIQVYITVKIAFQFLKNKVQSFYLALAIFGIYFGNAFIFDMRGYGDGWVFAFFIFCAYSKNPLWIILFSQLAFWTDERAIINTPFLFLWYVVQDQGLVKLKDFFIKRRSLSLIISLGIYFVIRFYLQYIYKIDIIDRTQVWEQEVNGVKIASIGPTLLKITLTWFNAISWSVLEAFWIIVFFGFLLFKKSYGSLALFLFVAAFLGSGLTGFMVYDSMRSLSYAGISIFIFTKVINERISEPEMTRLLSIIALVNLLYPVFY